MKSQFTTPPSYSPLGAVLYRDVPHTPQSLGAQWVKKQEEKDKGAEQRLEVQPMFCTGSSNNNWLLMFASPEKVTNNAPSLVS